jgi:prolipoprotein diacylglyceryl transferase
MLDTLFISWNVSPNLYEGFITLRYYSLLFGVSFFLGHFLMKKMFAVENCPEEWLDKILIYTVVGTILGARLGHVFFYDWDYYSQNLIEIPMVWKGGLASHGAGIAIFIAIWMYSRRITKKSVLWALDKVVITVAIASCFIRIGNLMNSEIIGSKSESKNAFFFQYEAENSIANFFDVKNENIEIETTEDVYEINGFKYPVSNLSIDFDPSQLKNLNLYYQNFISYTKKNYESSEKHYFSFEPNQEFPKVVNNTISTQIGIIPRIPTQLLEAFSYLIIFLILFWGYWKKQWYQHQGLILGLFLTLLFGVRFFIEFYKEHQTLDGNVTLNMGQWLSIPSVFLGFVFIFIALRKKTQNPNN